MYICKFSAVLVLSQTLKSSIQTENGRARGFTEMFGSMMKALQLLRIDTLI